MDDRIKEIQITGGPTCCLFQIETSRKEKLDFIHEIKNKLEDIEAIGIYGSLAQVKEGPY